MFAVYGGGEALANPVGFRMSIVAVLAVEDAGSRTFPPAVAESAVTCSGLAATIVGTGGADVIRGTAGRDVIVASGGDDVVYGLGGNDLICAGSGNDRAGCRHR